MSAFLPICTCVQTHLARDPCVSWWGLRSVWRLVSFSRFLFYSSCTCKRKLQSMFLQTIFKLSLCDANCHLVNYIHLYTVILVNSIHASLFSFQRGAIRYGLIIPRLNLSLRNSFAVRAHLEGLSYDDMSLRFNAFSLCFFFFSCPLCFLSNLVHFYKLTGTCGLMFLLF